MHQSKKKDKAKYEEPEARYKRALADYQNLRKRTAEEKQEFARYANEQLLLELLPVYDNLKASLDHIDSQAKEQGWAEGIKFVVKQFKDALAGAGVLEIEALGQDFDPAKMEAVAGQGSKVKTVLRAGYELNGKVMIAARVMLE